MFKKATKQQAKLKMALIGPSGSGKTLSSLKIASSLGTKIAVIDTEHGSASKYADQYEFDVCELDSFHPEKYIEAICTASQMGYEVIIIDSLSHAWMGKDGALELVNRAAMQSKSNNSYTAWGKVTPLQNKLTETIIATQSHIICTLRAKTEYVLEENDRGKSVPKKVGMTPIQRDGLEYEFDIVGEMDIDNNLIISKSRISDLSGKVFSKPDKEVGKIIKTWLDSGEPIPESPQSKAERVRVARNRLSLESELVKDIMMSNFGIDHPAKLSSEQVDQLVNEILIDWCEKEEKDKEQRFVGNVSKEDGDFF